MTDLELIEKYGKYNLPGFYDGYLIPIGPFLEEWKSIEITHGHYHVSNYGRIKSFKRNINGEILKNVISYSKYPQCTLRFDNKTKPILIHRLVAIYFIKNIENKYSVNHKNGFKEDNYISNLEWNTNSENVKHGFKNGLMRTLIGAEHKTAKRVGQYSLNGDLIKEWECVNFAAKELKIHGGCIGYCAKGNTRYSHVGGFIWKYI